MEGSSEIEYKLFLFINETSEAHEVSKIRHVCRELG